MIGITQIGSMGTEKGEIQGGGFKIQGGEENMR
jgi:hypothetical protein